MDETKFHDAHEWIVNMVEAIERQLSGHPKDQWRQLVCFGMSEEFACTGPVRHYETKPPTPYVCLSVATRKEGQPLTSLTDAINYHLRVERNMEKDCHCGSKRADRRLIFQSLPMVSAKLIHLK